MSFQTIRALIETRLEDLSIPVVYDNTYDEPPGTEYAEVNISYVSVSEPVLCKTENSIEVIRGNLQIVVRSPRAQGMARLEALDAEVLTIMNRFKDWRKDDEDGVICTLGEVEGPVHLLSGDDPLAASNISARFLAYG